MPDKKPRRRAKKSRSRNRFGLTVDSHGVARLEDNPQIRSMAVPRAGDVLRADPNFIQSMAAFTVDALRRTLSDYNRERASVGQREFDYPGRRGFINVPTDKKALTMPRKPKAGTSISRRAAPKTSSAKPKSKATTARSKRPIKRSIY